MTQKSPLFLALSLGLSLVPLWTKVMAQSIAPSFSSAQTGYDTLADLSVDYKFICDKNKVSISLFNKPFLPTALVSIFVNDQNLRETVDGRSLASLLQTMQNARISGVSCSTADRLFIAVVGVPLPGQSATGAPQIGRISISIPWRIRRR